MGELTRLGATSEFSGVLLNVLARAGYRPTVQGRLEGGVLVRLHHDRFPDPLEAEGEDVSAVLPELVRQAREQLRAHAPT